MYDRLNEWRSVKAHVEREPGIRDVRRERHPYEHQQHEKNVETTRIGGRALLPKLDKDMRRHARPHIWAHRSSVSAVT